MCIAYVGLISSSIQRDQEPKRHANAQEGRKKEQNPQPAKTLPRKPTGARLLVRPQLLNNPEYRY